MSKPATVKVTFTKAELWELMNCFSMSFLPHEEGNELANQVSEKLSKAYDKFRLSPSGGDRHGE